MQVDLSSGDSAERAVLNALEILEDVWKKSPNIQLYVEALEAIEMILRRQTPINIVPEGSDAG